MKNPPNLKITIEPPGRSISEIQAPINLTIPQTTSHSATTMTERKPAERFPCTFPECKSEFNSVAAMKRHKTLETDHEYCAKCDQDFKTEEQMLIHMIKGKAHIVCPVCGIEFRSEGGRDAHIRQFHRTAQNLICQGCKGTFRSASGLMRHIENGDCDNIPKERLRYEQNKRIIAKENLEVASPSRLRIQEGSVLDEDDMDGGVPLGDPLHKQNHDAITNQIKHGETPNKAAKRHWPALKDEYDETGLEGAVKDLMSFTEAPVKKEEDQDNEGGSTAWKSEGVQPTTIGTELTYQSQPASASTSSSFVAPTDATSALRRMYKDWKPEMYIDQFTGEYVCPCSKRFRTKRAFEQHILSKNISIRRINCPRCLRLFKSTAAFIAHCESSSTRCDVNEGNMYAQILEEISGGMIKTAGHNEDGTLKYEAGDVEIQKTVTIGRKW